MTRADGPAQSQGERRSPVLDIFRLERIADYLLIHAPALLDREDPSRVIGVAGDWVLQPEDPWEVTGYVPNVVFSCGAVPEPDGSVKISWGGADSVMRAGIASITDRVELCTARTRPAIGAQTQPCEREGLYRLTEFEIGLATTWKRR